MRIYYDNTRKNIVLGMTTRLFATGSLVAQADRGRVAVVYLANNFRELFIKHDKVLREDGSPAGATLQEVLDYLNAEFVRSPFDEVTPSAGVPLIAVVTFEVPANTQALYSLPIELDEGGAIDIDGALIEVD